MIDEVEDAGLLEAEARIEAKRKQLEHWTEPIDEPTEPAEVRDAPRRLMVSANLDPAAWPLAKCPQCDEPPRPVPPVVVRRAGLDGTPEPIPIVCDSCLSIAAELAKQERLGEEERREAAAVQERRRRLPELLAKSGAPPLYAKLTRASWERAYKSWESASDPAKLIGWPESAEILDGRQIFALNGLYGRGKTGFATAVLGEAIVAGFRCAWIDTPSWLRELKADNFANEETVWYRATSAEVALFDDFGAVVGSRGAKRESWDLEKLAEIARYRHMHGKPTIYTTNGDLTDLAAIDGSLPSRFASPLSFEMTGRDRRIEP